MDYRKIMNNIGMYTGLVSPVSDDEKIQYNDEPEFNPVETYGEKKSILTWVGSTNVNTAMFGRRMKRTILVIGMVVAILLLFMKQFALLFLVFALLYLNYAMNKVGAGKLSYKLTTHGVEIDKEEYYWKDLLKFYFINNQNYENIIGIDTKFPFPKRIFLTTDEKNVQKVIDELSKRLKFVKEEQKSVADDLFKKVSDKFSTDK